LKTGLQPELLYWAEGKESRWPGAVPKVGAARGLAGTRV